MKARALLVALFLAQVSLAFPWITEQQKVGLSIYCMLPLDIQKVIDDYTGTVQLNFSSNDHVKNVEEERDLENYLINSLGGGSGNPQSFVFVRPKDGKELIFEYQKSDLLGAIITRKSIGSLEERVIFSQNEGTIDLFNFSKDFSKLITAQRINQTFMLNIYDRCCKGENSQCRLLSSCDIRTPVGVKKTERIFFLIEAIAVSNDGNKFAFIHKVLDRNKNRSLGDVNLDYRYKISIVDAATQEMIGYYYWNRAPRYYEVKWGYEFIGFNFSNNAKYLGLRYSTKDYQSRPSDVKHYLSSGCAMYEI